MSLTMGFPKKLLIIWTLLTVITFPSPSSGKAITCTAGDFALGANASFTCYFPDDIDDHDHDSVYIHRYPFNAPNASGFTVLLCKVADVKASTCKGKDGYVLKRHTRNTMLVEVINVTEEEAGQYMCQFVPPSQSPTEMCNLTVHGAVTPSSADDRHSTSGGTGTVSVEILVAVIIVSVLAVAAVIVLAVLMYRRLRSKKSSPPTKRREESRQESEQTPAAGLNDSTAPLLETPDTRVLSPAASSAPTETQEESRRESVTTPAAGSVEKPPFVTQESVESYMQPLADFVVGKNSQPSQNSSKTAMPSVQDGIEMDSGVDLSGLKSSDTDTLKLSGSKDNISYNYEKNKNPMSLAKDSNKSDPASLLVGIYRALDGLGERLRLVEEVTSSSVRSLTSNNAKNSEEILQDLLRELSKSGTQLEQERDRIQMLLGEVQRGEVDSQTHEAILNTAAKRRQP